MFMGYTVDILYGTGAFDRTFGRPKFHPRLLFLTHIQGFVKSLSSSSIIDCSGLLVDAFKVRKGKR